MTAASTTLRGVLVAFAAYAVFAFSDASIKALHGTVPSFQVAFTGAILSLAALPFIKGPGDSWLDIFRTTNRPLWLVRFAAGLDLGLEMTLRGQLAFQRGLGFAQRLPVRIQFRADRAVVERAQFRRRPHPR